ncbi:DUF6422 family protein [Streptomyces sp. NPDC057271]|uniref:DUF6422 family protein n=1 Tax=unclassified Streptomyces TaxID=2593676 RepID=UPI00362ED181
MSDLRSLLTDEQSEAWEKAAYVVINARREAAALLARSGMEPVPDQGWFGSPCMAKLPFPPYPPCGCNDYKGDGGPCTTRIRVPETGPGSIHRMVPCSHRPSEHVET